MNPLFATVMIVLSATLAGSSEAPGPLEIPLVNTTVAPMATTSTTTTSTTTTITAPDFDPAAFLPRVLDVPMHWQKSESWGAHATLQMVLAYYGINKTQKQIAKETGSFGELSQSQILQYLKRQGLTAYVVNDHKKYAGDLPQIVFDENNGSRHVLVLTGWEPFFCATLYYWNDPGVGQITWTSHQKLTSIVVQSPKTNRTEKTAS